MGMHPKKNDAALVIPACELFITIYRGGDNAIERGVIAMLLFLSNTKVLPFNYPLKQWRQISSYQKIEEEEV